MASSLGYRLRRRAEEDIIEILDYIAIANPKAAVTFYEKISRLFDLLAQFPEMGRERTELLSGIRSMPLGNYVIFFAIKEELEIVRVLHGARDINENLF